MSRRHWSRISVLGVTLALAADVFAQAPPPPAEAPKAEAKKATEGKAAPAPAATPAQPGATPAAKPATPPQRRRARRAILLGNETLATYPAFRMLEGGGSRVSLEVSRKVDVTRQLSPGRVVYRLRGVRVPGHNARLPLPTAFFPTPVGRVDLAEQGDTADLVIELREPSDPKHRLIETPRGSVVLQIDFPPAVSPSIRAPEEQEQARGKRSMDTKRIGNEAPRAPAGE